VAQRSLGRRARGAARTHRRLTTCQTRPIRSDAELPAGAYTPATMGEVVVN
jgi:hypothetical protein